MHRLAVQQRGQQQHLPNRPVAESPDQPGDIGRRQRVAHRPGDRHAETRAGGDDPQVAGGRDRQPAPDRGAVDDGQGRRGQPGQPVQRLVDPCLVGDAVVAAGEPGEFRNVGARHKGAARAAEHDGAQVVPLFQRAAYVAQAGIHGKGHGIARRRPVEGHMRDRTVEAQRDVALCRCRIMGCITGRITGRDALAGGVRHRHPRCRRRGPVRSGFPRGVRQAAGDDAGPAGGCRAA